MDKKHIETSWTQILTFVIGMSFESAGYTNQKDESPGADSSSPWPRNPVILISLSLSGFRGFERMTFEAPSYTTPSRSERQKPLYVKMPAIHAGLCARPSGLPGLFGYQYLLNIYLKRQMCSSLPRMVVIADRGTGQAQGSERSKLFIFCSEFLLEQAV